MALEDSDIPRWLAAHGVPGIVDLHVHFMPDRVQQKVWSFFDRVADSGARPWTIPYRGSDDERLAQLRAMGVNAFSTLNYAHRPGMARWLNAYSTDMAARHHDVIHSGTFYPEPEVEEIVEEALTAGARIFKIHIQVGDFSPVDPRIDGAWRLLADAGVPVVIHGGDGPHRGRHTGLAGLRSLAERHPALPMIIAHAGLPDFAEATELAQDHPQVYLDTTMVGTDYMEQVFPLPDDYPELLARVPDRIVLGTDFPSIPDGYAHQLVVIERWGLGDDWLADVLWNTPRRLLGLPRD